MIGQPSFAVIEDLALDGTEAIADAAIYQDGVAALQDERTGQVETDPVAIVRRMVALPKLARHHAKHASAVIPPEPIGEKRDDERTDLNFGRRLQIANARAQRLE